MDTFQVFDVEVPMRLSHKAAGAHKKLFGVDLITAIQGLAPDGEDDVDVGNIDTEVISKVAYCMYHANGGKEDFDAFDNEVDYFDLLGIMALVAERLTNSPLTRLVEAQNAT